MVRKDIYVLWRNLVANICFLTNDGTISEKMLSLMMVLLEGKMSITRRKNTCNCNRKYLYWKNNSEKKQILLQLVRKFVANDGIIRGKNESNKEEISL